MDGTSGSGTGSGKPDASDRTPDAASRTPDAASRTPDAGSRTPDTGSRTPQAGSHTPQAGSRTPEAGHTQTTVAAMATQPQLVRTVRKVTINSQPWSNFTIDSDPAQHQTIGDGLARSWHCTSSTSSPGVAPRRPRRRSDVPADRDIRFVEPLR